ncbi:sigma-54-dependent Fis family transcriptional regulator [bacterium]|nr:sigma-54-dependent Fis family transcriptional regulator [bacterium]
MNPKANLLIIDDEKPIRELLRDVMANDRFVRIETAENGRDALDKLKGFPADIIVSDIMMPEMNGLELMKNLRAANSDAYVLFITGYGNITNAVEAMKLGAYDYITKPFDPSDLRTKIQRIIKREMFFEDNKTDGNICHSFENLIGQNKVMVDIYKTINHIAPSNATVLITGESGTGKELIAEAIHHRSLRKGKPFIKFNCASLTEGLINSELFGHEKGAFTGAIKQKKGIFELADKGTVFLDEIGDVPPSVQISLLRFLEDRTFKRIGGNQILKLDCRVICATNKVIPDLVKNGSFREDLYYRIKVITINAPPLRERRSDIPLLANYFLKKYSDENKRRISRISPSGMDMLIAYSWPGNVRELANVIGHGVLICNKEEITPACLPSEINPGCNGGGFSLTLRSRSIPLAESILVKKVLEENNWNYKKAAKDLDIARNTLYSKTKRYGIKKPQ